MHINGKYVAKVTGHLSERSFVRNEVVQIPKFDPNPNGHWGGLGLGLRLGLGVRVRVGYG